MNTILKLFSSLEKEQNVEEITEEMIIAHIKEYVDKVELKYNNQIDDINNKVNWRLKIYEK